MNPAGSHNLGNASSRTLGGASKTLRVYTFSGGGFDTAMQLGVVHALLTASYEKPDLVTGVSAGAISAVALAEVLGACAMQDPETRHAAQVSRFREILEGYRDGPLRLLMAQMPDGYERNARQATENLKLPIHLEAEREGREQAQRAESGLIRLMNELLAIGLPMRQAVLIVRLILGIREAGEIFGRGAALFECGELYWRLLLNLSHLSLLIGRIVLVLVRVRDDPPRPCPARQVLFRQHRLWRSCVDAWKSLIGAIAIVALPLLGIAAWLARRAKSALKNDARAACKAFLKPLVPRRWWNHFFSSNAGEECLRSILGHYALAEDLGDANALRELLVELFDPDYFGVPDMAQVGEDALLRKKNASKPVRGSKQPNRLGDYAKSDRGGITVEVLAADIDKAKVRPVPADTAVVDALMAATAIVPIFRAVDLPVFAEREDHWRDQTSPNGPAFYIDGENVNADPLRPTIKYLQRTIDFETAAIRFYSCVAFPISKQELPTDRQFRGLVRVATRSLELQRLQNALLERNFIKLYRETLQEVFKREPDGTGQIRVAKAVLKRTGPNGEETGPYKPLIAADVVSIESDSPLRLNEKIAGARTHEERRTLIDQAVADGCRATLTAWLGDEKESLHITGQQLRADSPDSQVVSCRGLIAAHLRRNRSDVGDVARRESSPEKGPGLMEICSSCRFFQERRTSDGRVLPTLPGFELPQCSGKHLGVVQPAAKMESPLGKDQRHEISPPGEATNQPTVSLLFSGGVFRGVYQIGVANALLRLQLRPNIVAGASVGSITAALLAEIFSEPDDLERKRKMARLATSFLALDRLILTDRFYDFVRRFTLRGGDSEFSLRDIDGLFRRYDERSTGVASDRARKTIAGLERLLYLSPYELNELVQAQRLRNYSQLYALTVHHLQELLDRNGASLEILGAEPLELLLKEHLLRCHTSPSALRFNLYASAQESRKIHLLATVTNLTKGKLRTLGSPYLHDIEWPVLREGLLASSAFPGVFRPRNSWEIFPTSADQDQYVDGGVMDNLPFASVVAFLDAASQPRSQTGRDPLYVRRPMAPHLIVTGSLEPNCYPLGPRRTDQVRGCWVALRKRARHIQYNRKIHDFEVAERDMHEVWERTRLKPGAISNEPLDIKVVAVKPEWLCGTFAFHPMLGFKRRKQAASIAHGCAGTMKQMAKLWRETAKGSKYFWEMDQKIASSVTDRMGKPEKKGTCWFCSELICPFSEPALAQLGRTGDKSKDPLKPETRRALASIYEECGKSETHPSPPPS